MVASLRLRADGTIDDATPDALRLLGIGLTELRSLPKGAFSPDPPDPEADAAFRSAWEASGRPDIAGEGTIQRLDGTRIRVRFVITPADGDRFTAILEEIAGETSAPPVVFTGRDVLSRWRAAERRLESLDSASTEAIDLQAEIERLRTDYQSLFGRGRDLATR